MQQENEFLFCCAGTHIDEEKIHKIKRLLGKRLDWGQILDSASLHGITPLLFHNLSQIANDHIIPEPVMDRLKRSHRSVDLQNMRFYNELRKILETLQNENIPVILLKGAALARTVYHDAGLRVMSDIDILVKKTDLQAAADALSRSGYVQDQYPDFPAEFYTKHHHLMPYKKQNDKSIRMEIHHNIASEPFMAKIDPDYLWENTQDINISGINALTLSPENQILHLCLHLSTDLFVERMRVLVDISEAIKYYSERMDWDTVIRNSNKAGFGSFVYYSLYLAKKLMKADLPDHILNSFEMNPRLNFFEKKLLGAILEGNIIRKPGPIIPSWFIISVCSEFFYTTKARDRIKNILKQITGSTFRRIGVFCSSFRKA